MSTEENERKYWDGFPEAPISTTFKWIDAQGFEQMTTVRGWKWTDTIKTVEKVTSNILDLGGKPAGSRPAPPPKPDVAATIAAEEGNTQLAEQLQKEYAEVPAPPDGKTWNVTEIARIVVIPQPDDRVNVELYADGHKFPDLKVSKWKAEQVSGLLKYVTDVDVKQPHDLKLPCNAYWLEGNEYTKQDGTKGHYKNVSHIRPA